MNISKQNTFWKSSVFLALLLVGCGGGGGTPVSSPVENTPTNTTDTTTGVDNSGNGSTTVGIDEKSDSYKVAFKRLEDFMRTRKINREARERMTLDDFQNVGFDVIDSPEKLDSVLLGIQGSLANNTHNRFLIPRIKYAIFIAGLDLYINEPAETFIFKELEYGIVTSEHTGKRWLDRNLGAKKVCVRYRSDFDCYGDYYQWGRPADGHETRYNHFGEDRRKYLITTKEESKTIKPEHDKLIDLKEGWAATDREGIERSAFWGKSDGTGVCPNGFRVPTVKELLAEVGTPYYSGHEDKPRFERLRSFLRIGLGGHSSRLNEGVLWSMDAVEAIDHSEHTDNFTTEAVVVTNSSRGRKINNNSRVAWNIRCIED